MQTKTTVATALSPAANETEIEGQSNSTFFKPEDEKQPKKGIFFQRC